MTLGVIYDLINYIVGKEWVGGTFTIPQLNNLLPMAQYDLLNAELEKVDAGELTPISGAVVGKSPLRPFYKSADLSIDVYGFANLPSDYLRWAGVTTSDLRAIEVVSHQMFAERQSNVLRRADINPFGVFANNEFCVVPYDLAPAVFTSSLPTIKMWYLRTPATPYYDYCQDSTTLEQIYMPVGSYITLVQAKNVLYDVNGNVLNADVTKSNMTVLPYTSKSTELAWDANMHTHIIKRILEKVSINLQEPAIEQYAIAMEQGNTQAK